MTSLQPLLSLLAQTQRERDQLALEHQRAAAAEQAAAAQAAQLRTYRQEYEARWTGQFRTDGPIELVHCYRGFIGRLSQAVDQQQHAASHAESELAEAKRALRDGEIRVASVRKLIDRRVVEVRVVNDRREQKSSDEFAARAAWNPASWKPSAMGELMDVR
jgi:flagellar protein FliJ